MDSPFKNDTFPIVWQAFINLYPKKQCECWVLDKQYKTEIRYGYTDFSNNCEQPVVYICSDDPIERQIKVLAHVAAGSKAAGRGPKWKTAFDAIYKEYKNIIYAMQEAGTL